MTESQKPEQQDDSEKDPGKSPWCPFQDGPHEHAQREESPDEQIATHGFVIGDSSENSHLGESDQDDETPPEKPVGQEGYHTEEVTTLELEDSRYNLG